MVHRVNGIEYKFLEYLDTLKIIHFLMPADMIFKQCDDFDDVTDYEFLITDHADYVNSGRRI